ncbi:NAD(P)/FAD-dependent oxidoreductase [Actinoplanes subtropicus]|uniref:NAD(P)/FAD-dependent oxidoreductase n=1 Tax=Actinoplanes subtropicus TaxID=543632 RepID=UPI00068BBAEA|nr:NAD(P)/FAD-dependent oxidoreductase [Actinoplanes subtropicus]
MVRRSRSEDEGRVGVVGAGPAGLTAAYELARYGREVEVFEADDTVGGISRTVERDGWRFDIGGHRFFTKVPEVEALWHELLSDEDFLRRPRMSRIFYRGKLFDYPLKPANALRNLGVLEAARCMASYAWVRVKPPADQSTFEGWVAARFGWRLYRMFFKTYTEKVWGVDATAIQADWAAQRIKNLSLLGAVRNALLPGRGEHITSLIEEFQYPKLGPGMMWERARDRVAEMGVPVHLKAPVVRIEHAGGRVQAVVSRQRGIERRTPVEHVISSMPLGHLVGALSPAPPEEVLRAAGDLRHRDFLTVALVVPERFAFPDNWIYLHDPGVRAGRVQNFGSWSPYLVKDGHTCLGLEYFVDEGGELWTASDEALVELAERDLAHLGLVPEGAAGTGYVVRMPKAYPVYDARYQANVAVIRCWLEANLPDVQPVGRNGMHRYNNTDHSMMTALLAARNVLGAAPVHDVWAVNVEDDYHEEVRDDQVRGTGRAAPVLPLPLPVPLSVVGAVQEGAA